MKKKLFAYVCLLLLIVTTLGCSGNNAAVSNDSQTANQTENNTSNMGRYVEQTEDGPDSDAFENLISIVKNENDELEYYYLTDGIDTEPSTMRCYVKKNGVYEKSSVDWINNALKDKLGEPREIILGQDNQYYMLTEEYISDGEGVYKVVDHLVQPGQNLISYEEITPQSWKDNKEVKYNIEGLMANTIQVSKNRILIYHGSYESQLSGYSLTENKEVLPDTIETDNGYCVYQNSLYYVPTGGSEIDCLDLTTMRSKSIAIDAIHGECSIQTTDEGNIYIIDDSGILHYQNGGLLWETVVDGSSCMISAPSYSINYFNVLKGEKDCFYIYYKPLVTGKEALCIQYKFDKNVPSTYEKEMTVYSIWENSSVRDALLSYQKLHPEVHINYMVALDDSTGATISDIIRALNTELLAGNGADIIIMDGLPVNDYLDKGVLLDMSDIINPKIEDKSILNSIAENYVTDGKVFCMPMRYQMLISTSREDYGAETTTLTQLANHLDQLKKPLYEKMSYEDLFKLMLTMYSDELIAKDGSIDDETAKSFLGNMKRIADNIDAYEEEAYVNGGDDGEGSPSYCNEFTHGSAIQLIISDATSSVECMSDIEAFITAKACKKETNALSFPIKDIYIPSGMLSINKAAKEPELAKDVVNYLFSEEIQSIHMYDGFPMNTNSIEKWLTEDIGSSFMYGVLDMDGNPHYIESESLTPKEKEPIRQMIYSLKTPINNNYTVWHMITEEGMGYLTGDKTLEQAANDVVSKINLYLSE